MLSYGIGGGRRLLCLKLARRTAMLISAALTTVTNQRKVETEIYKAAA
jgi:hypothetical protein